MQELFKELMGNAATGIVLTVAAYRFGIWVSGKLKTPLANPLLVAIIAMILLIQFTPLTLEDYSKGGDVVLLFLPAATAALAISIYNRLEVLKKNLLPILAGCFAGALTSVASVYGLSKLFGLDAQLMASILPKSVTTPIAIEIAEMGGGIGAIAVAGVLVTGVTGVIVAPVLVRILRINSPVEQGIAIGTSSHALGTSKAIELGETQGAMSGIAIGVAGMITVALSLFF